MKNQALFSSKDKSKTLKCRLLHFLFGPLRVNRVYMKCMSKSMDHVYRNSVIIIDNVYVVLYR